MALAGVQTCCRSDAPADIRHVFLPSGQRCCPMRLANVRIAHKLVLGFACILAIFGAVSAAIFSALARVETAAATKLFDETLARSKTDAAAAPDSAAALEAIAKLAAAASGWQKEVGDPEVLLARDPATLDQAIEVAKSPNSSAHMQEFREALDNARAIVGASLKASQASQTAAV